MRFVQARRMATLHPQARIECIKALLIAGRSRSEIGARLGLRRSVVRALLHRRKRDGVGLPRSRPRPKPVIITPPKPVPAIAFEPLTATAAPLLELGDNACRWPVIGEVAPRCSAALVAVGIPRIAGSMRCAVSWSRRCNGTP